MNDRDKDWLLGHFAKESYGKVMRGNVIHDYLNAERILNGYDKIKRRGCGCEYGGVQRAVNISYNKWLEKEIT